MTDQPSIFSILQEAGLTPHQAKETQIELNKRMNLAIMEAVYLALTPDEQDKLEKTLKNMDRSDVLAVTQALRKVCMESFNKVDADRLADEVRFKVMEGFWKDFSLRLTQDQKVKVEALFKKYLTKYPNLAKVVNTRLKVMNRQI